MHSAHSSSSCSCSSPSGCPLPGTVTLETAGGGLPTVEVRNAHASATLYLHGAHLAHFQPAGASPVLWMSARSWFEAGRPIRGGVPICWPWFGPNAGHPTFPGHGFARLVEWQLEEAAQLSDGRTRVRLALTPERVAASPAAPLLAAFPHPFALAFTVTVGAALEMELAVHNPGSAPFAFEEALHTYLAVGDVRQVAVRGLGGLRYIDKMLDARLCPQDDPEIRFTGETDRVYLDATSPCQLLDPVLGRTITVAKEDSHATVVWNPHVLKARAMPDFGDEEWPGLVCLESANVGPSAITLSPGATHRLRTRITLG